MRGDKINWLNILHFYQPPFQNMEIVGKVTAECYLPVTNLLLNKPYIKAVVNINGCLLELLDKFSEGKEVIENLKFLVSLGQLEVTGTGKYHPIFPLINTKEIKIQVLRQEISLRSFLDVKQTPTILYLPELAYWPEQTPVFEELGYKWIIIDEISVKNEKHVIGKRLLREKGRNMNLLVRERDLSDSLCNLPWRKYDIRTPGEFLKHSHDRMNNTGFIVTTSDVEVFGHHKKGRWKLLEDIYDEPSVNSISTRDIIRQHKTSEAETVPASRSTSGDDILARIYYPLWYHPRNRLHRLLWQLLDLALEEVRASGAELQNKQMDTLLSSSPFFWASCMPWYNGIIVENAADHMFGLLSAIDDCPEKILAKSQVLRKNIYDEVLMLHKTGKAEKLQDEFLTHNKINRKDLYHLIH